MRKFPLKFKTAWIIVHRLECFCILCLGSTKQRYAIHCAINVLMRLMALSKTNLKRN